MDNRSDKYDGRGRFRIQGRLSFAKFVVLLMVGLILQNVSKRFQRVTA